MQPERHSLLLLFLVIHFIHVQIPIERNLQYLLHWRRVLPVVPEEEETGLFMGRNGSCELPSWRITGMETLCSNFTPGNNV